MAFDFQAAAQALNAGKGKKRSSTAADTAQRLSGNVAPKNKVGRPVQPVEAGLSAQYPALRDEVSARYPLTTISPEVQALMSQAGKVTSSLLSGAISPDVQAQIERISAEQAIKGGLGMSSQAARNLTARDFGLTSMDLQQKGIEAARSLGDFDTNLTSLRLDFLTKMRGLDIDETKLRQQNQQFNRELQLNRFKLLSDNISNYYQLAFNYEQQKTHSQENLDDFQASIRTLNDRLRSLTGIRI